MPEATQILRLERSFDAQVQDVFNAWTDPAVLKRWWSGGPQWSTPVADVDAQPGGSYRLMMESESGERHTVVGQYRTVEPPTLLVYTWAWELDAGGTGPESTVTVAFEADGDATRVVVEHAGLPDEASRERHGVGWSTCLDQLTSLYAAAR
jgi:uncharacterized protein YndB with AHSA1/START domain